MVLMNTIAFCCYEIVIIYALKTTMSDNLLLKSTKSDFIDRSIWQGVNNNGLQCFTT